MTPKRIQLSRKKGYRKPEGAVVVSRPTKWGNPIVVTTGCQNTADANRRLAVIAFKWLLFGPDWDRAPYPSDDEIRAKLGGKDLACWCPLDQACHADVLLEIANP